MLPAAIVPIVIEIALTDAEARQALALHRGPRKPTPWIPVLASGTAAGLLTALAATLLGVTQAERAGALAIIGFLSFWAGLWCAYWLNARATKPRADAYLARLREPFRATFTADALHLNYPARRHELGWPYFARVQRSHGLILFWPRAADSSIVIPEHCFPSPAKASQAAAMVNPPPR